MQLKISLRKALLGSAALLAFGGILGFAANRYNKPKSIVHVVTLAYKDGTTEEQKKAVLDGVEKMASEVPGIKTVWLRSPKVQGFQYEKMPDGKEKYHRMTDAFAMEFESQAAFDAYTENPAHKKWEDVYVKVRDRSATSDLSN
jgi:hypothetical protein